MLAINLCSLDNKGPAGNISVFFFTISLPSQPCQPIIKSQDNETAIKDDVCLQCPDSVCGFGLMAAKLSGRERCIKYRQKMWGFRRKTMSCTDQSVRSAVQEERPVVEFKKKSLWYRSIQGQMVNSWSFTSVSTTKMISQTWFKEKDLC